MTFLRAAPKPAPRLPIESHGTRILRVQSRAVLSAYVPGVSGPDFMRLLEKQFGKEVTTRTWETVEKVVRLG